MEKRNILRKQIKANLIAAAANGKDLEGTFFSNSSSSASGYSSQLVFSYLFSSKIVIADPPAVKLLALLCFQNQACEFFYFLYLLE